MWPYSRDVLARWADRLCETYDDDEDVYVYTNNDPGGAALRDVVTLAALLRERGWTTTRVPTPQQAWTPPEPEAAAGASPQPAPAPSPVPVEPLSPPPAR